jgi:integrase/recombinase XerD
MKVNGKVIDLVGRRKMMLEKREKREKRQAVRSADGVKYFNAAQIKELRRIVRDAADLGLSKGRVTAVREWAAVDILTSAGLRVGEVVDLRCGDVKTGYAQSALFVRAGKGSKARTVEIPESLKRHLKRFIGWKEKRGEPTGLDDFLFTGQRGPWTAQAVQQAVKKYLKWLGLYENGKSVHALRHSYAVELYRREHDLRAVQKQLGHSSIQTTQIYADVVAEDVQRQVKGLWGGVK